MEKKIYKNKKEKVLDLLAGLLFIPVVAVVTLSLTFSLFGNSTQSKNIVTVVSVAGFGGFIYLCLKRKFIALGILLAVVLTPLVMLGNCLLSLSGGNIFSLFFRR